MTVQSVSIGADPDVLKVGLPDGSFFYLRLSFLPQGIPAPRPGDEPLEETMEAYRAAAEAREAETAALRLVALREHSRFQLGRKLRARAFGVPAIGKALDLLEEHGLLDDGRFAVLWLRSRLASLNEGRVKLLSGLLARGVDREAAEKALRETVSEEAELEAARRLLDSMDPERLREAEAMRMLRAAGFSGRVSRAAVSGD